MKQIISDRIEQVLCDSDPEKRKFWEAIPRKGDVPTPEEWLKYAVEKLERDRRVICCGDLLINK